MSEIEKVPLSIGKVVLTVHDLERLRRFYHEIIGLHELAADAQSACLGVGATVLLELRRDLGARVRSPQEPGLFHTAFLLPTRADLGRWLSHAAGAGVRLDGAADHAVSEALYLADPEGNGIEIYADRPRATWRWVDGMVVLPNDRLDLRELRRSAGPEPWRGLPEGSRIGHVHLQVGALEPAEAFYGGVLGFELTCRYPGASFYGTGGYHHHLATNIWNSRDAPPRSVPTTGLAEVEIRAADEAVLDGVARRIAKAGLSATRQGAGLAIRDPWGTPISLVAHRT